jgi:hypothetical protein
MGKKPNDRRPDEKPAGQASGKHEPRKPESGRMPEDPQRDRGLGRPAGYPIDKERPTPEARGKGRDLLDSERSDRESGRPVQLEEDDEGQPFSEQPHRADAEPGGGQRRQ